MRHTVRAILLNSHNQCLFVQHNERDPNDRGKWSTVGGGLDPNEDHQGCLMRELVEEFGDSIGSEIVIGPRLFSNQGVERTDHFYVVWFRGDEVRINAPDEILQFEWFDLEQAYRIPFFFGIEAELFAQALQVAKDL